LTDWPATCRAAAGDVRRVLAELSSGAERARIVGAGMGGDDTTAIDAAAERTVVARLESEAAAFTLVSEELGEKRYGDGGPWVVLDPIDGSLNAKRGIPFFSLSIAVADGPTMGDVSFGYVYDFGSGEEWTARRGGGAWLNGDPLGEQRPKDDLELLCFEATTTAEVADKAAAVAALAYRLRIMGSLALSLCHLAAGRVDGVCSLKPARSVDIAAGQLLVRELGYSIELFDDGRFDDAPLDLEGRSRVAAAGNGELCRRIAEALTS
jgi:myo-inositol-1(or 4)-monophosphatase